MLPTLGGQTALNLAMELRRGGRDRPARHARDDRRQRRGHRHGGGSRAVQAGDDRDRPDGARSRAPPTTWTRPARWSSASACPSSSGPPTSSAARAPASPRPPRSSSGSPGNGLDASPISEILIEQSIAGWKEYELEVMRDRADNCVIICSIENVDPMGVHTGDSITVAPAQTLSDVEYQAMRDAAFACIRRVGVETGGSNVQFAVHPDDGEHGRHRDEPAGVAQLGPGVEGHRVPDRQDRRPPRGRLHARRDPQRHHRSCATRTPARSCAAPRPASSRPSTTSSRRSPDGRSRSSPARRACSAPRCSRWARSMAIGRTFPESLQKGAAVARERSGRAQLRPGRGRRRRLRRRRAARPLRRSRRPSASSWSRPRCGGASSIERGARRLPASTRGSSTRCR